MFEPFGLFLLIFSLGVLVSLWINDSIYRWSYTSAPISSWQLRASGLGRLSIWERVPVVGWLLRSRRTDDVKEFGRWFWIRPALIELLVPWCYVVLFWLLRRGHCMPEGVLIPEALWPQYVAYSILLFLLIIATFIDFDERMIPDCITIPGTLIGLIGSTFFYGWNWLERVQLIEPPFTQVTRTLHANSPESAPILWQHGSFLSLVIVLVGWTIWCLSLVDFPWITRRGWRKAFVYAWVRFWQAINLRSVATMMFSGWVLLGIGYFVLSDLQWDRLLSAVVGMSLGGFLVWAFRMVASEVLGMEALGFGDVTLMAMVGAFLGWQVVWLAFFLAPLFGIAIVIVRLLFTGDTSTPFGPYLSAATIYLMLDWRRVWEVTREWMFPATFAPWILLVLLVILGALLWLIHRVERLIGLR